MNSPVPDLKPLLKYLQERGLNVRAFPGDRQTLDGISISRSDDVGTSLYLEAGCWVFEFIGEIVPGPDKNNFRVSYQKLDDALLAVWAFYFGETAVINDWVIPLHRYPDWNFAKLQHCLANAATISEASFTALCEQRWEQVRDVTRKLNYAAFLRASFIKIRQRSGGKVALWLRRDLGEGYFVD